MTAPRGEDSRPGASGRLRRLAALACLAGLAACSRGPESDPTDREMVAAGQRVYSQHCASCHGANLEGQPNWRERRPDGKLPAPPHDRSGHTWHHPDAILFDIVKRGMGPHAPPGYLSDMPAFAGVLQDREIHAVLAYIKSSWPADVRDKQARITEAAAK